MDFKPIRNKIRSFSFDSLTNILLDILHEYECDERKQRFWHPLLLLKWNLEFSQKNKKVKTANRKDVQKLLIQLNDLEMSHQTFNIKTNKGAFQTFSVVANQQITYQQYAYKDTFTRQYILFSELYHKYDIQSSFQLLTGISIDDFLRMNFIVYLLYFQNNKSYEYGRCIDQDIKEHLINEFDSDRLKSFLKLLTISQANASEVIREDKRILRSGNLQPFEPSFFTRKPFLLYKNEHRIPYKDILHHTFHQFIYEYMKMKDDQFTTELGHRVEKYVELGLKELELPYLPESELKKLLPKSSKVVDFCVQENILIEVKAIEMKPYSAVNPTKETLSKDLRKSIVKAYAEQMVHVANEMKKSENYFGLIITYKKLFLGTPSDAWKLFLEEEVKQICSDNKLNRLPFQNLYIIDLRTWDYLVQVIKTENMPLVDIIKNAIQKDAVAETKLFHFLMHLEDDYQIDRFDLSYLEKAYEIFEV